VTVRKWPDVRASDETVTVGEQRFPNPLRTYTAFLDERIFGTLSTIHGDLNLENISQGWKDR
jgi:hypothetical protein